MVNWLNYKVKSITVVLLIVLFSFNTSEYRWGFTAHRRINRMAIFTLPNQQLFKFYKKNIEYITEHAVDADKRRYILENEAPCHFIDADAYKYLDSIPHYWKDAILKYGEDTLTKHGIAPWHIGLVKLKLQQAFEEKNLDNILKYSSDMGHYIGDIHVPLHTTKNYNGQLTNQIGIHGLWESRLIDLHLSEYMLFTGKAKYIENVSDFTWKIIKESHQLVDSVLKIERIISKSDKILKYSYEVKGNTTQKVYSKEFSGKYHTLLNGMVQRRLKSSIYAVGCIWYTAWVDAGQPNLELLNSFTISDQYKNEIKKLDEEYNFNKERGRSCFH
ncbi:MAG: S1/P1 Nuclease [Crocinitomicaceae bacterium]|nr:S1/P1 Nuclease [Crocinitomicaceae bacterium]